MIFQTREHFGLAESQAETKKKETGKIPSL